MLLSKFLVKSWTSIVLHQLQYLKSVNYLLIHKFKICFMKYIWQLHAEESLKINFKNLHSDKTFFMPTRYMNVRCPLHRQVENFTYLSKFSY